MMHTPTLPIQVSGASAQPAAARGNQNAAADGAGAFSQTLSQAHAQRSKDNAPAPQAAKPATPAVPPKQANADKAVPAKPAEPTKGNSAEAKGKADADGQEAKLDAQGESADGAAVASVPAEMPVADMLALVASFLPEKAASVVKDTPAAEVIAVRAARAADLAPVAPRAAQAADVVDTITPAFDAALADSAAAAADAAAGAAATLPAAPETAAAAAPAPAAEADQSAMLAMAQARPEGVVRPRGATEAQAPKAAPVAANAAASEGIARFDGIPTARSETVLPAPRSALEAALADQPAPETRAPAAGVAQQQPVRTQAEPQIAARPAALAAADNAVREVAAAPVSAPVQQASLNIAQAAAGVHTDKIAARVGTPGWDNQVGQKIVWMVAGKEQSATLTLNPPDLGPMQVVLSVNNDQATVTFSSAQPEVRAALENAMPRLREMLDDSGVALSNASVNAGMPDQRQAQGDQRPGNSGNNGNGLGRFETNGSASEAAARSAARPAAAGNGLVDTFA